MRINTPVTQNEYVLTDSDMIVSTTDLKGQITHINADFLRISGFTEQELLGQPHNIVRHPDMPPEAFADMWQNLKAGRPWTGLVKNRCKNGDYYWVEANATPISENGQVTGYMSVRRKPSRTQVEAAAAAYQKFRDGSAGRLAIRDGKVVKRGLFGRFGKGRDTTLKARLVFVVALMSVLLLAIGGLGLLGMSRASEGLRVVYEERTQALDQVTRIDRLILRNRSLLLDSATDSNPEQIRKNGEEIEQNIAEIGVIWKEYLSKPLGAEEKQWAERFTEVRGAFVQQGLKPALQMLAKGQNAQAVAHYHSAMDTLYPPVRAVVDGLVRIQTEGARHEYQAAQTRYQRTLAFSIAAMAIGLALALWVGILLIRAITRPLAAAIGHFARIAQGHYDDRIDIEHHDEIGKVLEALKSMQIKLGFDVAEAKRIADENLRIKIGLDNVSTGVMIADNQRKIIYANRAVVALLGRAEADIRKQLPSFSANSLVGTSIDAFHRQPAHQAQLLSTLTATHTSSFEIGGRSMVVAASPVINERGERLGAVAEWVDRTAEVAVEKEVADIVQAAARGDFSRRMALDGKDGFYLQLGEGINQFVATCATGMEDVARMLGALARGDLTEKISADYEGTFGQLKDDANSTAEKLTEIVSRIKEATDAINTAAKEIAAGNADLSQRTEEQATSLEETASSMEELTSTVKQNAENAKQANQLARGASDIAVRGGEVVAEVVDTMSAINDSSKKIVDIISVIDGIAFQTNILALNAAVEAARAGEQGRGFAVVAAEVRSLAQRSAAAAKEIKALISDSVSKVDDGSKLVANAGSTMEEIVNAVKRVTDIMAEISAASIEQSSGIEQVNQAVTQMDEVTQQNAALVEQAAAAAESMEEQAQTMAELVAVFRLDHEAAPQRAASLPQPARQALPKTSRETQRKPSVDKVLANIAGVSQEDEWDEF